METVWKILHFLVFFGLLFSPDGMWLNGVRLAVAMLVLDAYMLASDEGRK